MLFRSSRELRNEVSLVTLGGSNRTHLMSQSRRSLISVKIQGCEGGRQLWESAKEDRGQQTLIKAPRASMMPSTPDASMFS